MEAAHHQTTMGDLGRLAGSAGNNCLCLAADFRENHLVLRTGCTKASCRHRQSHDSPQIQLYEQALGPIWDTLNIATLGTVIALVIAVPVAFAAARNTTPHPIVRTIAIFIIVASRSVNSLIWALMLVFIFGPGVLAGTIAIGLRSIGFCAKLLYEGIEEIDHTQVEAIEATGASGPQKMVFGIVPQVLPTFAGIGVFRWDINIRESTILGLVGAGGIGLELNGSINTLAWTQVSMILLVILLTVVVSEWVSAKVRGAII